MKQFIMKQFFKFYTAIKSYDTSILLEQLIPGYDTNYNDKSKMEKYTVISIWELPLKYI